MTDKFKVGDRVKFIGEAVVFQPAPNPVGDLFPGTLGTVTKIWSHPTAYPIRVKVDDGVDNFWWCAEAELEPTDIAAPAPPPPPPTVPAVSKYIQERVTELQAMEEKHPKGTEHYYPLVAGQFELLRLAVSLGLPDVVDKITVVNPVPEA